jgi:hypothetical protein
MMSHEETYCGPPCDECEKLLQERCKLEAGGALAAQSGVELTPGDARPADDGSKRASCARV